MRKSVKKKIKKAYKKFRHSVRLFLESNEKLDDIYLNQKNNQIEKIYGNEKINEKKIVFTNYMGRGYGCNCKYLAENIIANNKDYELVWLVNQNEDVSVFPEQIRLVNYQSQEAMYELSTAKFWISNYHLSYFIKKGLRKKDNQVYIQMWHGSFGIKKIERHVGSLTESKMWTKVAKLNSDMTDYWISNSDFETDIYKSAFWNVKNIKLLGHPRNDIFFNDNTKLHQKVLSKYNADMGKKIVLYMPTFREDYRLDCYNLDGSKLCEKLSKRFGGEWLLLVRLHPRIVQYKDRFFQQFGSENVIDVTDYDDVQELLAIADVMISDYSSCIFDYLLAKKPAFIYATDIEEYENERGLYYSLYEKPFSITKNNDELLKAIDEFNEKQYLEKVEQFLDGKGSVEEGKASEKIVEFIDSL